jgi:hypothetical protein
MRLLMCLFNQRFILYLLNNWLVLLAGLFLHLHFWFLAFELLFFVLLWLVLGDNDLNLWLVVCQEVLFFLLRGGSVIIELSELVEHHGILLSSFLIRVRILVILVHRDAHWVSGDVFFSFSLMIFSSLGLLDNNWLRFGGNKFLLILEGRSWWSFYIS